MSWIQTRRRAQEAPAGRPMEDTLRRQMAWAAGTEQFQHRDPLYHVTESFQQTFDAIGRRHARQLAGGRTEEGAEERADQTSGENQMPDQTSARSFYERSRPEDQDMVRRFSETAFQRGTLSGAVLEGTGQTVGLRYGLPAAAVHGDQGPVRHEKPLAVQLPDVGEIDQKAALAAEKQPLGEAGLQGGQGLTVDDALLGAVDQTAPPGALRPYQVAQGEADPETV